MISINIELIRLRRTD